MAAQCLRRLLLQTWNSDYEEQILCMSRYSSKVAAYWNAAKQDRIEDAFPCWAVPWWTQAEHTVQISQLRETAADATVHKPSVDAAGVACEGRKVRMLWHVRCPGVARRSGLLRRRVQSVCQAVWRIEALFRAQHLGPPVLCVHVSPTPDGADIGSKILTPPIRPQALHIPRIDRATQLQRLQQLCACGSAEVVVVHRARVRHGMCVELPACVWLVRVRVRDFLNVVGAGPVKVLPPWPWVTHILGLHPGAQRLTLKRTAPCFRKHEEVVSALAALEHGLAVEPRPKGFTQLCRKLQAALCLHEQIDHSPQSLSIHCAAACHSGS